MDAFLKNIGIGGGRHVAARGVVNSGMLAQELNVLLCSCSGLVNSLGTLAYTLGKLFLLILYLEV